MPPNKMPSVARMVASCWTCWAGSARSLRDKRGYYLDAEPAAELEGHEAEQTVESGRDLRRRGVYRP